MLHRFEVLVIVVYMHLAVYVQCRGRHQCGRSVCTFPVTLHRVEHRQGPWVYVYTTAYDSGESTGADVSKTAILSSKTTHQRKADTDSRP